MSNLTVEFLSPSDPGAESISWWYVIFDLGIAIFCIFGNGIVIAAMISNLDLRTYRNYFVFILALADLLEGSSRAPLTLLRKLEVVTIPPCFLALNDMIEKSSLNIIYLSALFFDRYWEVTDPFGYYGKMNGSTITVIFSSLLLGGLTLVGLLPIFFAYKDSQVCTLDLISDKYYLLMLYIVTVLTPGIAMSYFYWKIYSWSLEGKKRMIQRESRLYTWKTVFEGEEREQKLSKNVVTLLIPFLILTFPARTSAAIMAFFKNLPQEMSELKFLLIHLNSAINPYIYTFHLEDIRMEVKDILSIKTNQIVEETKHSSNPYITSKTAIKKKRRV